MLRVNVSSLGLYPNISSSYPLSLNSFFSYQNCHENRVRNPPKVLQMLSVVVRNFATRIWVPKMFCEYFKTHNIMCFILFSDCLCVLLKTMTSSRERNMLYLCSQLTFPTQQQAITDTQCIFVEFSMFIINTIKIRFQY